jgi:hypothetical protein
VIRDDWGLGTTPDTDAVRHAVLAIVLLLGGAWALSRPIPECPPRGDQTPTLSCELAVTVALGALPADHAPISRTQFLYGSVIPYFPPLYGPGDERTIGVVKFTYEDGSRDYVDVAEWHGEVTAAAPKTLEPSAAHDIETTYLVATRSLD